MQYTKRFVLGLCAAVVLATSFMPLAAQAQTYEQTREQLIAEIYRLLAQLAQMQHTGYYYYDTQPYRYTNQYQYYTPRVLSESTGNARVEVETLRAIDVEDDEASVYGNVHLNNASYADVWFEYGQDDDDLDERSRMGRIDRHDRRTFRADLEDLDEDERYYYRAIARDPQGRIDRGVIRDFYTDEDNRDRDTDDEPDVETGRAFNIDEDSAEFDGEVDMNDFRNGRVFFAYGEDEDQIEDIARDYDEYRDIDEDGDDLQVILVDSDLDADAEYEANVFGLDDDTEHFFTICVEYEDEDGDDTIICGDVESFETDRD
jgi:hypothetical protein